MGIRVYSANGAKLERLQVLDHTIVFGADGYADGSILTPEEIERLRRFHFRIEITEDSATDKAATEEPEATEAGSEEAALDVGDEASAAEESADSAAEQPVDAKPARGRGRAKRGE